MIWFECTKCGKKHGRPETSIGTLVFCDCGQGNTVPWESTVEPPTVTAQPVELPETLPPVLPVPGPPRLEPVPVGEERLPAREQPRQRTRGQGRVRNPSFCFNHTDLPSEYTCVECEERFCSNCIVHFQNNVYCGPCKNVVIRRETRPPKISLLALFSLIAGLVLGPTGFCVIGFQMGTGFLPGIILAILLQLGALGLGMLAVYKMEQDPHLMGKSLAMTGMLSACLGILVTVVAGFYNTIHWV